MAVVLILAVTSANLMHTGFQQRIWAAKDNTSVLYGLWGASILTLPFFLVFGLFGMIAYANLGIPGLVAPNYLAFLGAFFLVQTMYAPAQPQRDTAAAAPPLRRCSRL